MRRLALLASAAALVAALGMQAPAQAADEIVIGFAIAQSGWMNAYDGPPSNAALMAIDEINAKGGVLGKQLKAVFSDTKSSQADGAKAGQEVLANGANFVVVSCDYDMGSGAATVANDNQTIAISLCASDAKMGVQGIGPYAFTMSNSSLTSGAVIAEWAYTKKNWRKAYLLLDTSIEYDKTICAGFKQRWEKLGAAVVGEDTFKQDDASIASQITRLQETISTNAPDLVHLCSYGAGAVSAIRQIRGAGINIPISGGDSMDGDYWTEGIPNLNDHYTGTYGSVFGDDPRATYNDFFKKYAEKNGEAVCCSFAVAGYSVVQAIALAAERAGSIESDAVLAELNKFNKEDLLVGPTTYSPDLHINLERPQAVIGIKDGKGHFVDLIQLPEPPPLQLIFKK
ncbi:MAG: amino acid ABC transporter substrate-binding protein [Alphaproteobacteria bacterium]|nr:amino acid ABC transporter substrate-binding protein [Alphaproteobacteria bacterium]